MCLAQCESVCSVCWRATSWVINDRAKSRGVRRVHKLFLALQIDTIWAKAIYGGRTWFSVPLWASVLLTAACLTSGGTNCNLTNTNTNHRQTAARTKFSLRCAAYFLSCSWQKVGGWGLEQIVCCTSDGGSSHKTENYARPYTVCPKVAIWIF